MTQLLGTRSNMVYKACTQQEWQTAGEAGVYAGSPADKRDGFIHFSASHQLSETLSRHFAGQADLVLVAFSAEALAAGLRWEASRGGDLFPHFYGALPASAALKVWALPLGPDGRHRLPELPEDKPSTR